MKKRIEEITERITEYLSVGGLFNPEMMNHDKVRDILIDCRDALTSLLSNAEGEVKELPEDVKTFIRIATLEIQSHRSKSDEQMDALFQKAYQLYSKYDVEASQPTSKGERV